MRTPAGFRLLWLAATASALGNGVRWIALPLLAVRQTTDPGAVSLVTVAEEAPWVLFGLLAGILADRYDRRRVLGAGNLARAGLMVAFTLAVAGGGATIPVIAMLVLYTRQVLHLDATGYGLLVATFAVGGIGGGLAAGRLAAVVGTRACLVGGVVGFAACAGVLAATGRPLVAGGAIALFGAASAVTGAVGAALRQTAVPDRLLGRVTSAFRLVGFGAGPLGALAAGAVAHGYGLRAPFLGAALISLAMVVPTAFV